MVMLMPTEGEVGDLRVLLIFYDYCGSIILWMKYISQVFEAGEGFNETFWQNGNGHKQPVSPRLALEVNILHHYSYSPLNTPANIFIMNIVWL